MSDTTQTEAPFRFLRMLEKDEAVMPTYRRRRPYFRPVPPPPADAAHIPVHTWRGAPPIEGTSLVDVDVNAGYLSAASSVSLAWSHLAHTGAAAPRLPGYFLVADQWWGHHHEIPSPLGTVDRSHAWVTLPTLVQLDELSEAGYWPQVDVLDSWTASEGKAVRLRHWTTHINALRADLIDQGKPQRYDDLKTAYSAAVTMMIKGEGCGIHRPDWSHAILAQHSATLWRKAWRSVLAGHGPVAIGETDALTYTTADFNVIFKRGIDNPKQTIFRIDPTGKTLGSFKIKRSYCAGDPDPDDDRG